jgi:hypothetical protein
MEDIVTVLIKIEYTIQDDNMPFADIILMDANEYLELSEEDIEQIKLDKYNEWKQLMVI